MDRPDFKEVRRLIGSLYALEEAVKSIPEKTGELEAAVQRACTDRRLEEAAVSLADIPVEELKNARSGIRTAALEAAGYHTLRDIHQAADRDLLSVPGIGEQTLGTVRAVTGGFLESFAGRQMIRLTPDAGDAGSLGLITKIFRFRQAEAVCRDIAKLQEELSRSIPLYTGPVKIRSRLHWMFSLRRQREDTVRAISELIQFCRSPLCLRAGRLLRLFDEAANKGEQEALEDFRKNSAGYYSLLERLSGTEIPGELLYSSIPAQLAARIRAEELDLAEFHGDLRAYQDFGARYILRQKRVLLGDEMGLGKTIQAIAAMAHLYRREPGSRFLTVCPASVLVNWCREIRKFSGIEVHLVHGAGGAEAFERWRRTGGAAVTSYEGMGKIVREIDRKMRIALLVIDEAHYIKNPEAQRTKNIRRLYEESDRILLMTGTPLENRVDEMCELIRFVRPDLEEEVRARAALRCAPEFRELLAPVYLRRRRDQVLQELPPLTEQQEWCRMTEEDRRAYAARLEQGQFAAVRRVSFLQGDLTASSKAIRLRELCGMASDEGRKVVVFSYFRETIRRIEELLADVCIGSITGSTPAPERQERVDRFAEAPGGAVLICQTEAGGTGLNIQAASVVIFCEPQIKPSLTNQALSRVYRMGQTENVLVCHLLCEDTVDEAVVEMLREKQEEFDRYADKSALADAAGDLVDREWIRKVIERERQKYLPALSGG